MVRRRIRRGRAAILWGVVFFLASQLGLSLALDRWLPDCRDRDYAWKMVLLKRLLDRESDHSLVLFLGSSRTMGGFQTDRISGQKGPDGRRLTAFNLGQSRTGPIRSWVHFQELLDQGIRPRLLVVEVLPFLFNQAAPGRISEEDWIGYEWPSLSQMLRYYPYCAMRGRLLADWLCARLLPAYYHRNYLLDHYARSWVHPANKLVSHRLCDSHGWYTGEGIEFWVPWAAYARTMKHWQQFGWQLKYCWLGDGPAQALRDLVQRCRQEHIPVALVLMPEPSLVRGWYSPLVRAQLDALLNEVKQVGQTEVIDAREWIEDNRFCDALHLLPLGAQELTDQMNDEIQRILIETVAPDQLASSP